MPEPSDAPYCEREPLGSGEPAGRLNCSDGICRVRKGAFVMGDSNPEAPDQCPPRKVELPAFEIDETEVSRGAYAECVDAGVCTALPLCESAATYLEEEELPATCVTWHQAAAYCEWTGGRLPTEAEWEKAARGTEGARWPWGSLPPNCAVANFRYPPAYCFGGVIDVGTYAQIDDVITDIPTSRSPFGLLDMAGNAWEWTADWYDARYYEVAPVNDPQGPEACAYDTTLDRGECREKVIRGGAFNTFQDITRTTARGFLRPEWSDVNVGFRCAYDG